MTLAKRLRERRLAAGYETQQDFAKACGFYSQIIQRLEMGKVSTWIHLPTIADKLGTTIDYLLTGRTTAPKLVEAKGASVYGIPLLTLDNLESWAAETFKLKETTKMIPATHVSSRAFAIKVPDDSMFGTPALFLRGDVLIVEPQRDAHDMDFIVAKKKDQRPYFRQLVKVRGIWQLQPLNTDYAPDVLDKTTHIYGTVIAMYRDFD